MRFEWDEQKNKHNRKKHGVSFEVASEVFDDPLHASQPDPFAGEEQRWLTLGVVEDLVTLLVVHTARFEGDLEVIRIISARKATAHERSEYERGA